MLKSGHQCIDWEMINMQHIDTECVITQSEGLTFWKWIVKVALAGLIIGAINLMYALAWEALPDRHTSRTEQQQQRHRHMTPDAKSLPHPTAETVHDYPFLFEPDID